MHDCAPFDYPAELLPFDGDDSRFAGWWWCRSVSAQPATLTAAETSLRSWPGDMMACWAGPAQFNNRPCPENTSRSTKRDAGPLPGSRLRL